MSFEEADTPKSLRSRRAVATALVMGLAALTAQANESDLVHDIQRYCAVWLAERPARPRPLGRLHAGGLLPAAGQGPGRRARPQPRPRRRHGRASRAGPGHRHGPQACPADPSAPAARRPPDPPAPTSIAATASVRNSARSSRPPDGPCSPPARTGSSSCGPGAGPSPTSAGPSASPRPGSATRSTRPSASSSVTWPTAATTSTSRPSRRSRTRIPGASAESRSEIGASAIVRGGFQADHIHPPSRELCRCLGADAVCPERGGSGVVEPPAELVRGSPWRSGPPRLVVRRRGGRSSAGEVDHAIRRAHELANRSDDPPRSHGLALCRPTRPSPPAHHPPRVYRRSYPPLLRRLLRKVCKPMRCC